MAENIGGPVGMRFRSANVTNGQDDQTAVIRLLSRISTSQGGKKEDWPAPPLAGPDGDIPKFVADAIWDFQSFWKARGVFHNIDGVVDPGGNTLRQMNSLAGGGGPLPGPIPPPGPLPNPEPGVPIEPTVGTLARIFTYRSPWRIVGSGGGAGGASVISAGAGSIDFASDDGDSGTIKFFAAGGSIGATPVSLTYSSRSMMSVPGLEQTRVRARTPEPLEFDDMTGPMAIASFTATSLQTQLKGGSLTIYFLGLPMLVAVGSLIIPGGATMLGGAAMQCKAIGMTAGEVFGIDSSFSASVGYGWS